MGPSQVIAGPDGQPVEGVEEEDGSESLDITMMVIVAVIIAMVCIIVSVCIYIIYKGQTSGVAQDNDFIRDLHMINRDLGRRSMMKMAKEIALSVLVLRFERVRFL